MSGSAETGTSPFLQRCSAALPPPREGAHRAPAGHACRRPRTCVLGADEGHLVGVGLQADEAALPVHGLVRVRVEGVEPGPGIDRWGPRHPVPSRARADAVDHPPHPVTVKHHTGQTREGHSRDPGSTGMAAPSAGLLCRCGACPGPCSPSGRAPRPVSTSHTPRSKPPTSIVKPIPLALPSHC